MTTWSRYSRLNTPTDSNLLVLGGALDVTGGDLTINWNGGYAGPLTEFVLVETVGGVTSAQFSNDIGVPAGWMLAADGNNLVLEATPEPVMLVLFGSGLLALGLLRRRVKV